MIDANFVARCKDIGRQIRQENAFDYLSELTIDDLTLLGTLYDDEASISPHAVSPHESMFYYSGISQSSPRLVYRTGKEPWIAPSGYRRLRQLRPVFNHKLKDEWKNVGPKVRERYWPGVLIPDLIYRI